MENFPTNRLRLIPRVANLATLAVVVSATFWSGAQRPENDAAGNARRQHLVQIVALPTDVPNGQSNTTPAARPQSPAALQPDAIKTVGFTSTSLR